MHEDARLLIDELPDASAWSGIDADERARRESVLADIRRRIVEDGPRRAAPSPSRGRLFMPFAALEGYGEMLEAAEADAEREG